MRIILLCKYQLISPCKYTITCGTNTTEEDNILLWCRIYLEEVYESAFWILAKTLTVVVSQVCEAEKMRKCRRTFDGGSRSTVYQYSTIVCGIQRVGFINEKHNNDS